MSANQLQDYYQQGPWSSFVRDFRTAGSSPVNVLRLVQPAGNFPDPPVPAYCLFMMTKGVVRTRINLGDGWFVRMQRAGSFVLAPPNTACDYQVDGQHELIAISMPQETVAKWMKQHSNTSVFDFGPLHADAFRQPLVQQLCQQLLEEAVDGNPHGDLFADHLLIVLVNMLIKLASGREQTETKSTAGPLANRRIRLVIDFIQDHLLEPISLQQLADIAGTSKSHFSRQFQLNMGVSPYQFVIEQKTEKAKQLMLQGDMSLAEIAATLGFSDQSHFGRHFKKIAGMTPTSFLSLKRQ